MLFPKIHAAMRPSCLCDLIQHFHMTSSHSLQLYSGLLPLTTLKIILHNNNSCQQPNHLKTSSGWADLLLLFAVKNLLLNGAQKLVHHSL
jgi:hypothetical protein